MTKKIDCRTLECPAPVLETKEFLEQEAATKIDVIVDNDAAVENVTRFLNFQGFEVSVDSDGISSTVSGRRDPEKSKKLESDSSPVKTKKESDSQKILVILSSQQIGKGDDALGQKLMINFVKTLKELDNDLWRLVLLNHGVKFSTKDSKILEELKELEQSGVDILVCGACLTHLGLMNEKIIGETTNMLDVVTSMQLADKIINL
ncbi:sulfurtransferase-like selenium metabolism protein YedF [Desulfobacula sp.]|uniref:sulfurtransferase-like selenium metabolism protein YedF n=1 Tax=Desulfobacula sp. TaxID=2593537 RepID=UPI0025C2B598|nr:sulfurtransferase-like selenium metabolism protein YedF [Desulfobacula sp.]MBC2705213.1 sulfurtransferase-like selenium metabolism protein YedF [Desulfobacula sp.]